MGVFLLVGHTGFLTETTYNIGEAPATRVSLSLSEGTAEAIRGRVGQREFSAFIVAAVERELRGQVLDEYLADHENRRGPVSESTRQRARQVFDEMLAGEGERSADNCAAKVACSRP